ncbi:MAG TPA: VOC family protein [Candidatus Eremiobacteraceae bacterium]
MPRPTHFEIPSDNPQKAADFYTKIFGWKITKWDGPTEYWLVSTGDASEPGIDGGLLKRRDPVQPCVNTITVPDLEKTMGTILSSGGTMCVPKMAIPGVGWLAYFKDLDENIFGVMQPDGAAK